MTNACLYSGINSSFYADNDGIIREIEKSIPRYCENWENAELKEKVWSLGYRGTNRKYLESLFREHVGKTYEELIETFRKKGAESEKVRARNVGKDAEWDALRERFGGHVLNSGRLFDVTDMDFSYRISLKVLPFEENKKFVRENRNELVKYAREFIANDKRAMNKIGSMNFYVCTEMILTRTSEVEFKFSVKKAVNF